MVTLANVNIWNRKAGIVMWDEQKQSAVFEYDADFERAGLDLAPLQMPVAAHQAYSFQSLPYETFMGLPGLLADALPDAYGKALLDRWLATVGRTSPLSSPICAHTGMEALTMADISSHTKAPPSILTA